MKKYGSLLLLLNLLLGALWFARSQFMPTAELPTVKVSVPIAQAMPSPREDQVTKHLENPRLSELTGYLEVIKASRIGSNDLSDAVYFYTVHTAAGPVRFQPVVRVEENLHALHGGMVHLRESDKGYSLLNKTDERKFTFEQIKAPQTSLAEPAVKRILVTPNFNGVKTRDILRLAEKQHMPFQKKILGPECLAPTGTQIFALLDQTISEMEFPENTVLLDFIVASKSDCLQAEYTSLGFMPYITKSGLKNLQVRFRLWNGKLEAPHPEAVIATSTEEPQILKLDQLSDGAGCGELKVSARLELSKLNQVFVIRAHQVGDALVHRCQTTTDLMGVATCTVSGLNPSLPYLISAQNGEHFDFQIWSTQSCVDPAKPAVSFVKRLAAQARTSCDEDLPVVLRTENVAAGSQILVIAEDELGTQESCLATVNGSEGVGLAKCLIPGAVEGKEYTLLAMYDSARAWAFKQVQKKPKTCH